MKSVVCGGLAFVAALFAPSLARAQPYPATLGVSYAFLRFDDRLPSTLPAGWLAALGGATDRLVSPVVEIAGSFRTGQRRTQKLYTLQGGLRVSPLPDGRVRPFSQLVAGVAASGCCSEADVRFVLEPGGGVDLPLSSRVAFQAAASAPLIVTGDGHRRLLRLRAGIAFSLKK